MKKPFVALAIGLLLPLAAVCCAHAQLEIAGPHPSETAGLSAVQEQRLLDMAHSIFGHPDGVSRRAASAGSVPRHWCATMQVREIENHWDELSASARSELMRYGLSGREAGQVDRPTYKGTVKTRSFSTSDGRAFKILYTTDTIDPYAVDAADASPANGVPDYIDAIEESVKTVWQSEIVNMGWVKPPGDGDNVFDIYIIQLEVGYLGITRGETAVGDNPNSADRTETLAADSYMLLANSLDLYAGGSITEQDVLRSTIAHEFFHAIQYGYNYAEDAWLMEATATWVEDEVYDNINLNLDLLEEHFLAPDLSLTLWSASKPLHPYAMWIYFRYASEQMGQSIVRDIWDASAAISNPDGGQSMKAVSDGFQANGATIEEFTANFAAANYVMATSPQQAPFNYEEAASYPNVKIEGSLDLLFDQTAEFDETADGNGQLGFYAADYIQILKSSNVQIDFESSDAQADFGVYAIAKIGGAYEIRELTLDQSRNGSIIFSDDDNPSDLAVIVLNLSEAKEDPTYKLSAQALPETPVITSSPCLLGDVGMWWRYDCKSYSTGGASSAPRTTADGGLFAVTWNKLQGPSGFAINSTTGAISWLPTESGEFTISISATVATFESEPQTFTVSVGAASQPPLQATSFEAFPGDGKATLEWALPKDPDLEGLLIVRNETNVPADENDGVRISLANPSALQYVDDGLTNEKVYYYAAFTTDAQFNYSDPSVVCIVPEGSSPVLSDGWNLATFPIKPKTADLTAIDASCETATIDNKSRYSQQHLYPDDYVAGYGFWINCGGNLTEIQLTGKANKTAAYSETLYRGWNIIGNPFLGSLQWTDANISLGPKGSEVPLSAAIENNWTDGVLYGSEEESYALTEPNAGAQLEPWKGHFLKIKSGCTNCSIKFTPASKCELP